MTRHKKTTPTTQKHLSQDSVEQYIFGKGAEASRHRIERQLLEDKFSADAIDGLSSQTSAKQMNANMSDLKARLQKRIAQQKQSRGGAVMPFGMQPYAIAASVAIVLVCSIVVLFSTKYFSKTPATESVAQHIEKKPVQESPRGIPETTIAATESASLPEDNSKAQASSLKSEVSSNEQLYKDAVASNSSVSSSAKIVSPETSKPAAPVTSNSVITEAETSVAVMDDAKADARSKDGPVMMEEKMAAVPQEPVISQSEQFSKKKEATTRTSMPLADKVAGAVAKNSSPAVTKIIKGRVIDVEDGLPIPGTVVSIKGTNVSVYTNQSGEYTIAAPEGSELAFNFIGYISYRVPVEEQTVINARLSPDIKSLSEVVVIGADEKNTPTSASYRPAQPEKGMPEFMKTIEQTLEASPNADYSASGVIKLSFTVQPDGSLTNVKVLKSLCPECDQAAVQAVTEASRWKPAQENGKPVSQKMKIRVPFKPKKK